MDGSNETISRDSQLNDLTSMLRVKIPRWNCQGSIIHKLKTTKAVIAMATNETITNKSMMTMMKNNKLT